MPKRLLAFVAFAVLVLLHGWREGGPPEIVDLGVAHYPPGAEAGRATLHDWDEQGGQRHYRVGYDHAESARVVLRADHARLGARFGFQWVDEQTFGWRMPPECVGREWACIYPVVKLRSAADLAPLLSRIREAAAAERLTTTEAAAWLLDFVQKIPYRLPHEEAFGLRPPALVASEDWGDCDSKALLLISLLEQLGIDAVLLVSQAHAHALVGIDVPTRWHGYKIGGREYAWAETTSENAPLGWLHPKLRVPDDWYVVAVH